MKGKLKYTVFVLLLIGSCAIQAQTSYRHIKTMEYLEKTELENPKLIFVRSEIEKFTYSNIDEVSLPEQGITIPIIIHSVYKNEYEKVTSKQVVDQVRSLNRDFNFNSREVPVTEIRKLNIGDLIGNPNISFCLASAEITPGNEDGIIYKKTIAIKFTLSEEMKAASSGGSDPFDVDHYLNIWVVELEDGNSGFAQMPGGDNATDGIVIDYRFFGAGDNVQGSFRMGKTLTHLVGNYLNLYPLWSRGLCQDDFVLDTPIHNGPNHGCPSEGEVSTCYLSPKRN